MSSNLRVLTAMAIFAITVFIFFSDVLVGDRVLLTSNTFQWQPWRTYANQEQLEEKTYRTDSVRAYLPRRIELSRSLRSGRFPLWNPYVFCGCSFVADPQSVVFYPISLMLAPLDPARAMGYDVAIHFFIALLGMYLFLRTIGCSEIGRMIGAFAYGFSSFLFIRTGHPTFLDSASWIPFFFYSYERAKQSERTGTLLLVLFLSLGYLAGMPQIFLFGVVALVIYAIHDSIELAFRRQTRAVVRNARVIGISGVLSALIVAIQIVPFVELIRNSNGLGVPYGLMSRAHVWHPVFLLRTLVPNFFGNQSDGTNWLPILRGGGHPYYAGFLVYCGIGSLLLALSGLVGIRKSRRIRGLLLLLLLSVGMGTSAVLLKLIYAVLPLAAYSRITRVSVISCFAIAGMAGKGLSVAAESPRGKTRRYFIIVLTILLAAVAVGALLFWLDGASMISDLSHKAGSTSSLSWYLRMSSKLQDWIATGGADWLRYERRQVLQALLFAAMSFGFALLYLTGRRPAKMVFCVASLLLLTLVVDLGVTAKTYYATQPEHCLFRTDGIRFIQEVCGEAGKWRVGNLRANEVVFPPNVTQNFHVYTFTGVNTVCPSGHFERRRWAESSGGPFRLSDPAAGRVGDVMGVRYLVTEGLDPLLMGSPIFEVISDRHQRMASLRLMRLGEDERFCFIQHPHDAIKTSLRVPECKALDFWVGFEHRETGGDADSIILELIFEGQHGREVSFEKGFDLEKDHGRWHEFRLDLSGIAGSLAKVSFEVDVPAGREGGVVDIGWSGFDFVLHDCQVSDIDGGYEVDLGPFPGLLSLTVATDVEDLPLEIAYVGPETQRAVRWITRQPVLNPPNLLLDVTDAPSRTLLVRSDFDFRLTRTKVVHQNHPETSNFRLVYDGDMCIYENSAAFLKGVCVDKDLFAGAVPGEHGFGTLNVIPVLPDLASGVTGLVKMERYEPERVVLDVCVQRDCFLLFQDTYYPGWVALVDGVRRPMLRTDLGFRALELASGDHRIVMEFRPFSLRLGLALSCLGILLAVVYAKKAKSPLPGSPLISRTRGRS